MMGVVISIILFLLFVAGLLAVASCKAAGKPTPKPKCRWCRKIVRD